MSWNSTVNDSYQGVENVNEAMSVVDNIATVVFGQKKAIQQSARSSRVYAVNDRRPNMDKYQVPDEYMIKIKAIRHNGADTKNNTEVNIVGKLQEKFSLGVNSIWKPLIPMDAMGGMGDLANSGMQLLTGRTLIASAASRRIWAGTSPIVLNIVMRLEAINDAQEDVANQCRALMQLCLPTRVTGGASDFLPFLAPAGPSPFVIPEEFQKSWTQLKSIAPVANMSAGGGFGGALINSFEWGGDKLVSLVKAGSEFIDRGTDIDIRIGTFLKFKKVIVKSVDASFDNKFDRKGQPISATVTMVIETYEIISQEDLVYEGVMAKDGIFTSTREVTKSTGLPPMGRSTETTQGAQKPTLSTLDKIRNTVKAGTKAATRIIHTGNNIKNTVDTIKSTMNKPTASGVFGSINRTVSSGKGVSTTMGGLI